VMVLGPVHSDKDQRLLLSLVHEPEERCGDLMVECSVARHPTSRHLSSPTRRGTL
jgi:hypothetical protein